MKNTSKTTKTNKKPKTMKSRAESVDALDELTKAESSKGKPKKDEIMDRTTLKNIAGQLKGSGASIKVLKSDSDEALQRKLNEVLQSLPTPEVLKKLDAVDPNKLVTVLKRDCMGLFINLTDVSCVRCPDAVSCVSEFLKNLREVPPDLSRVVTDEIVPKAAAKAALAPVTKYDPSRLVFIRGVKNPNPPGDDLHDTIRRVLADQPETLGELRAIVERDFDLESDGDFMKFVTTLRDPKEGVIKLDADLTDSDKVSLREAGYEV